MNQCTKIWMIDRLATKHNHERFAAMSINIRGRITEPMDVFRIDLGHGASSHSGSNSRYNRKNRMTENACR